MRTENSLTQTKARLDLICELPIQHIDVFQTDAGRRSPRKAERKPIYVLNLDVPQGSLDNLLDPSKSSMYMRVRYVV